MRFASLATLKYTAGERFCLGLHERSSRLPYSKGWHGEPLSNASPSTSMVRLSGGSEPMAATGSEFSQLTGPIAKSVHVQPSPVPASGTNPASLSVGSKVTVVGAVAGTVPRLSTVSVSRPTRPATTTLSEMSSWSSGVPITWTLVVFGLVLVTSPSPALSITASMLMLRNAAIDTRYETVSVLSAPSAGALAAVSHCSVASSSIVAHDQSVPVPVISVAPGGRARSTVTTPLESTTPMLSMSTSNARSSPIVAVGGAVILPTRSGAPITSKPIPAPFVKSTMLSPGAVTLAAILVQG